MIRHPDHITFAWPRTDSDHEIVGTLNGETIEDTALWNYLVERTLITLQLADPATSAYNREDMVSVMIPEPDEHWQPIVITP